MYQPKVKNLNSQQHKTHRATQMKIYIVSCKLCGKTVEAESHKRALSLMKVHLMTHERFSNIVDSIAQMFVEVKEEEVELVIAT